MFQKGITPDVVTFNTLIDGSCKANRLTLARQLFIDMQAHGVTPDVVSYSSLLDGLCKCKRLDEAVALLEDMEDKGIKPDTVTYSILMDSLCEAGQLEDAAKFFSDLVSKGLQPSSKTYNIFVKGYCKKGLMTEAARLLRIMEDNGCFPDGITYNTIIRGYILNNDAKALYYRDLMVGKEFEADADTFALFVDLLSSDNISDSPKGLLQNKLTADARVSSLFHDFPIETYMMKLNEDQSLQLLSVFWILANLSDNLSSNFEQ
ncbi:putative pentatricopeptide repeat-containing protein At1g12700, mitochondrial [Chenopodium quinoa]|uniref:putative pentatricopeptide repeat-containing protein At1g12700, mitochondrial n=1 Tax=Chenopodium quinoa TaxID=63459 RepID=UPI000B77AB88|nr:putative pentatricopeptide repeat-containing protein At1g12700, mitochondrial [Chenopodium quinoa]